VERVGDENRVQNQARAGRAGPMRGPWESTAAAAPMIRAWG
jgi:hypothetical protein